MNFWDSGIKFSFTAWDEFVAVARSGSDSSGLVKFWRAAIDCATAPLGLRWAFDH